MKLSDAIKLLEGGTLAFLAEYRGGQAVCIPYVSKKTGKSEVMLKAKHAVEVGSQPILVDESLKDGTNLDVWKAPATKGQRVLVEITWLDSAMGSFKARGKITPITA